jgi:hypothetical protein
LIDRCTAITKNGSRCAKEAEPGSALCWSHDPANEEERRRIASRGGKASTAVLAERRGPAAQEIRELKDELRTLARDVKEGEVPPPVGTALNQIYNTLLRAMDQERRTRETGELEERLASLEERAALRRGASAS